MSKHGLIMQQHILIIDDDTSELRRLREILSRAGYSIMTASDPATAQKICNTLPVSFILSGSENIVIKKSGKKIQ
ncbi:MAG: response regulator [Calditrichaeota bacterium]|nr:MAG: response regulator [Calditrichota bacterium]